MPVQEVQHPELLDLIQKMYGTDGCSYDGDANIPTSFDLDDENWQEKFFQELGPRSKEHVEKIRKTKRRVMLRLLTHNQVKQNIQA